METSKQGFWKSFHDYIKRVVCTQYFHMKQVLIMRQCLRSPWSLHVWTSAHNALRCGWRWTSIHTVHLARIQKAPYSHDHHFFKWNPINMLYTQFYIAKHADFSMTANLFFSNRQSSRFLSCIILFSLKWFCIFLIQLLPYTWMNKWFTRSYTRKITSVM